MMTQTIVVTVNVDEKRRVLIDLPEDVPLGPAQLEVRVQTPDPDQPLTREQIRAKLIAAGLVNPNAQYAPPDAEELSPEEEERIGRLLASGKTIAEMIDEEREDRY